MKTPRSYGEPFREMLRALCSFTNREKRGILYLLPLLILLSILISTLNRPSFEKSFPRYADRVLDSLNDARRTRHTGSSDSLKKGTSVRELPGTPFAFDPNTITLGQLCQLGFTERQARGILNYRSAGKVFRTPADFADCYTVSDAMYERLFPFIVIGEKFRSDSRPLAASEPQDHTTDRIATREKQPDSLFLFDPNQLDETGFRALGFTKRQTEVILRYREMIGGFRDEEEFAECYPVSDRFESLKPYLRIVPPPREKPLRIELNSADSAQLVAIRGIGPATASRIIAYRNRLGGFAHAEQLQEIQGMTERNYEMILQQISVDSSKIQKIDINFADPKQLAGHPYLTALARRKILKQRQLKGGWHTIGDMTSDKTLSTREAEKLSPYLRFTPFESPQ